MVAKRLRKEHDTLELVDDDELRFNDVSTYEDQLHQNGIFT